MPTITAINPQRRRGRYNIMVDGEFALAVSEKVIVDLNLRVGDLFDSERLEEASLAEEAARALAASLRLLESRQRSQKEIVDRLNQHGYHQATIEQVEEKLAGLGLIDDIEFASAWVESRSRCQPSGAIKLKSELIQKGVARETIDSTLSCISERDELSLAKKALAKHPYKAAETAAESRKNFVKQANFLGRRGFKWETIRVALKSRFGEMAEDE